MVKPGKLVASKVQAPERCAMSECFQDVVTIIPYSVAGKIKGHKRAAVLQSLHEECCVQLIVSAARYRPSR
eukprot:416550-Rhodomonas_salina.2